MVMQKVKLVFNIMLLSFVVTSCTSTSDEVQRPPVSSSEEILETKIPLAKETEVSETAEITQTEPPSTTASPNVSDQDKWRKAYIGFLNLELHDNDKENSKLFLRDIDSNNIPELIVYREDGENADTVVSVYSFNPIINEIFEMGDYYNPKLDVSDFTISNNPNYPGLFTSWWGGGVEHYGYLTSVNNKLQHIDVIDIDRTGDNPKQIDLTKDEQLIDEVVYLNDNALEPLSFAPVVVNNILIGGSNNWKWVKPKEFAQKLSGQEVYKLYSLEGFLGLGMGSKVTPETEEWSGPYAEFVKMYNNIEDKFSFAISCEWNPMPRKPIEQKGNNDLYKEVINKILEDKGLFNAKIDILQNYKIDFEGDGVDEVVLYAENAIDNTNEGFSIDANIDSRCFSQNNGSFSILILRKVINGEVKNIVVKFDVFNEEALEGRIRYIFPVIGFADLNGDGKMEFIASEQYYEGFYYEAFEIDNESVTEVLYNGIGA